MRGRRRLAGAVVFHPGAAERPSPSPRASKAAPSSTSPTVTRQQLARHHVTLNLRFAAAGDVGAAHHRSKVGRLGGLSVRRPDSTAQQAPDLVSLGRIDAAPFWIFYRGSETLDRLSQLKGKRALRHASPPAISVDRILAANGVKARRHGGFAGTRRPGSGEAAAKWRRRCPAILPPIDLNAPSIQAMLRDPNIRLMNITQAEAITRLFPSLNKMVLPQGVIDLAKNIPPSDVNLNRLDHRVRGAQGLCTRNSSYLLAQVLKEEHSGGGVFRRPGEFPSLTDPELPMAEEAVDYYRNGPSFLQRYLPFWMINYAKRVAAILVAAVAIIIPLFTYAPRLYAWLGEFASGQAVPPPAGRERAAQKRIDGRSSSGAAKSIWKTSTAPPISCRCATRMCFSLCSCTSI